jgi:AraC-like DNA-binding protein
MVREPLPRELKKAIEWLEAEPARPWRLRELAAASGAAPRTLQKLFRRFLGCAPIAFVRKVRFDRVRQELLRGPQGTSITEIATRCGFAHLGRFATEYRRRYGESPSTTVQRSRRVSGSSSAAQPVLSSALERPAIAVFPFDLICTEPGRAAAFADEIALALWRLHWINVVAPPHAQYHLRGRVRESARGLTRVTLKLINRVTGRYVWATAWEGDGGDPTGFEERVAIEVARAIQPAVLAAENERASRLRDGDLTAWDLAMRALPCVTSVEAAAESMALELLEEAMERARATRCRSRWRRGAVGCAAGITLPRGQRRRKPRLANWRLVRPNSTLAMRWQRPCWRPATRSPTISRRAQFMPNGHLPSTAALPGHGVAAAISRPTLPARTKHWRSSRSRAPSRRPIR